MSIFKVFFKKSFYVSAVLGAGCTFTLLKPAREDLKYKMNNLMMEVEFQNMYDRNNKRVEIDYSKEEAKSLARKEFMGDPFSKAKLNHEFTKVFENLREKLG